MLSLQMFNLASGNQYKDTAELTTKLLSLDENVLKAFEDLTAIVKTAIPAASQVRRTNWMGKTRSRRKNRQKVDKNDTNVVADANDVTSSDQFDDEFVDVNNRFAILTAS